MHVNGGCLTREREARRSVQSYAVELSSVTLAVRPRYVQIWTSLVPPGGVGQRAPVQLPVVGDTSLGAHPTPQQSVTARHHRGARLRVHTEVEGVTTLLRLLVVARATYAP